MITKKQTEALIRKIVDERIAEHNKDDYETITKMQEELGWWKNLFIFGVGSYISRPDGLRPPLFSVNEKIEALYNYFKLNPKKKEKESIVIAEKIKKDKK